MAKKRVLFVNEFSQLATGFATYMRNILPILYDSGKYEIAEHGIYVSPMHPNIGEVPWKVYPNEPDPRDQQQVNLYHQNKLNQFGGWRFENVCCEFQPDIVCTISDPWMGPDFVVKSPYRKYFKYIQMPTCDGEPQKPEWLALYKDADILLTYSKWAKEVLERQSGGELKVFKVASPPVDIDVFKPEDKDKLREELGLKKDLFIVQTVMRNQPRKLFPELMKVFVKYLELCESHGNHELAARSYLYLHTTYPDVGWDLPAEIRRHKLSHKVLMTYMCPRCNAVFPSFFQGEHCICSHCHHPEAGLPNTAVGVSRKSLAKIMGAADMYVQYSICLAPDQDVLTKRGWIPIQDVNIRDRVWTHKGRWQQVLDTMKTPLGNRQIVKIVVDNEFETLQCTTEHPIYALQLSTLRLGKELLEPQFIPVNTLCKGDLIASRIDDSIEDIDEIDLAPFATTNSIIANSTISIHKGDTYPRYVVVNQELCKFIGLFVSDGHWQNTGKIAITSNRSELSNINLATSAMKTITGKTSNNRVYPGRNGVDVQTYSRLHADVLASWCKKHSDKCLPDWVMKLPIEKQKYVLQGLFMGDGYWTEERNVSVYVTISSVLAEQIKTLLERNRIIYNVHKDGKNRQPQYRFEVPGNIAEGYFVTKRSSTNSVYSKDFIYRKVKCVINMDSVESVESVYNIEVANDNSYTTRIGLTHNCEGFGMPINDAKAVGVPIMAVDYSAMSEQSHSPGGMPIKVERFFQESLHQTNQQRALPDNQDAAQTLYDFAILPKEKQREIGMAGRKYVEDNYSSKIIAQVWADAIDSIPERDVSLTWQAPPHIIKTGVQIPDGLNNEQFVQFGYTYILQQPNKIRSAIAQKTVAILNAGYESGYDQDGKPVRMPVDRQRLVQSWLNEVNRLNTLEKYRYDKIVLKKSTKTSDVVCTEV